MNIFYLDQDPERCAEYHCDKHSSKMCVEYAQMLSTAHRVLDGEMWIGQNRVGRSLKRWFLEDGVMNHSLYKASHINHPSNVWVRQSDSNYEYLYKLWKALCKEYSHRYNRIHLSWEKLHSALIIPPEKIKSGEFTEPPPAMKAYPHCIIKGDSITSYQHFYWEDKREFAKWTNRNKPTWWIEYEQGIRTPPSKCVTN